MLERFPMTACGTEATPASMVVSSLDLEWTERRPSPPAAPRDHAEMVTRMLPAPLALPLLLVQVQKRRRHDLGVELRRRDGLRRHPDLGRALALGHPGRCKRWP